jgi:periplasmic divalent cation tolerance protein
MASPSFVELILTCASWQEAQAIADMLLKKRLIACAEFIEVKSKYLWHDKLEEVDEVKLVMETVASNFEKVEAEVAKLHSYDTFVLYAIPASHISRRVTKWLEEEL